MIAKLIGPHQSKTAAASKSATTTSPPSTTRKKSPTLPSTSFSSRLQEQPNQAPTAIDAQGNINFPGYEEQEERPRSDQENNIKQFDFFGGGKAQDSHHDEDTKFSIDDDVSTENVARNLLDFRNAAKHWVANCGIGGDNFQEVPQHINKALTTQKVGGNNGLSHR
jgi:hypothetical protein